MKFSDIVSKESPKTVMMNFSLGGSPIKIEDKPTMVNFSEDPNSELVDYQIKCFSLLERIRLAKRTPRQVLRLRVNEVVRFLRMSNADKIKENKYTIVQYLNEYVYEIIVKLMNEPGLKLINLRLQLGLPSLIRNLSSVRNLERFLLQAKREYKNRGYLTKRVQDELSKYYTEFMNEFLMSIEDRYLKNSGKEGILSGSADLSEQNPIKLASFSESTESNIILDTIYKLIDLDSDNFDELFVKLDQLKPEDKFKDCLMDDPELTKLINEYIDSKSTSAKEGIRSYLTKTVEFSQDLKIPNFSLTMDEVTKLSGGSLPEVINKNKEDDIVESNKKAESINNLDDILPPADELFVDDPGFKSGILTNFGRKFGFVALKSGNGYNVKLYNIPRSNIRNFSEWSKVPFKSIKVSAMDELSKKYIR